MSQIQPLPIACELPEDERQCCAEAYRAGLFSYVEEVREIKGGYALRFAWDAGRIRELGAFLALDSSCCSFLDHSLEIPRGKETLWLSLSGPDEARQVLRDQIQQLLPETVPVSKGEGAFLRRLDRADVGVSGLSLAAILCCAGPAVGAALLATSFAWPPATVWIPFLLIVLAVVTGAGLRRSARRPKRCCGG